MRTFSDGAGIAPRLGVALRAVLFAAALLFGAASVEVAAQSLDQLRAAGVVGERYDGYAVVRDPAPAASVRSYVDEVNARRRQVYEARAAEQNVAAAQVGRIYARQIFDQVPAGTWFLDEAGRWVRK